MSERIERANWIEVREDATLCAIHVLARFLIYDISLPRKEIPGFEIVDVVAVLDTFSSAGVLAMLWTLNGVFVTGLFAPNDDKYKNVYSSRLVVTTLLSVPLWITVEWVNHWPISGGIGGIVGGLSFEYIPTDTLRTYEYPYDGSGNNIQNEMYGLSNQPRVRIVPNRSGYFNNDGRTPRNEQNSGLPSARRVMEEIFRYDESEPSLPTFLDDEKQSLNNDFVLQFGLLLSFDMARMSSNTSEPFPIECDGNLTDILYCPVTGQAASCNQNNNQIEMFRTVHSFVTSENDLKYRATINEATPFLDLEIVYGTSNEQRDQIRNFEGGLLRLEDNGNGLFPVKDIELPPEYNSAPGVYSLIIVFMRFHNLIAESLQEENPDWEDDQLYSIARNYNIAVYQSVVMTKYIPALLGDTLGPYTGYNKNINPSVDEFFAAISYRYAHSETPNLVRLRDAYFLPLTQDPLFLRDVFGQLPPNDVPNLVQNRIGGIEPILRGMVMSAAKPFDESFVDDMNIWSEAPSVLDVQRSRDVGIPPYNDVRRLLGLEAMSSIRELVLGEASSGVFLDDDDEVEANLYSEKDLELLRRLEALYGGDIEKVDTYVGTLFEAPEDPMNDRLGPIHTKSIRDQFKRIRIGDRFWYENVFSEQERLMFPSLEDIIKEVGTGMEKFPSNAFAIKTGKNEETCSDVDRINKVVLLGGDMKVFWSIDGGVNSKGRSITVTLKASQKMSGPGFLGVGWGSSVMNGAEIWFCTIISDKFSSITRPFSDSCSSATDNASLEQAAFSCCVARGNQAKPSCVDSEASVFYPLEVVDWCLSESESIISVQAPVCDDEVKLSSNGQRNCFALSSTPEGDIDMIVAYNPSAQNRPHGFQRRSSSRVNLKGGILTQLEESLADDGLIAYHAISMYIFWMFLAPLGVFIVRFMKTRKWRLIAHISIMGVVGGLMIPIILGVEFAVGATRHSQEHSIVGIGITVAILFMFVAGRIRYSQLTGQKVGKRTAIFAYRFHKITGYTILLCSWWNCYTGLVRISPADSFFQVIVLSSFSLGYDIPVFGWIKQHLYWPQLGLICLVFLAVELWRQYKNGKGHLQQLEDATAGKIIFVTTFDQKFSDNLEEMTVEDFLEQTRLGSMLCILDGHVLDVSEFAEYHPGGANLLEGVIGTDITEEVAGLRDVNGLSNIHSFSALQKMKTLAIAVLVDEDISHPSLVVSPLDLESPAASVAPRRNFAKRLFRRARILDVRFITPFEDIEVTEKTTVLLRLFVPTPNALLSNARATIGIPPGSCFKFRSVNDYGSTFEGFYTPVRLLGNDLYTAEEGEGGDIYDFLIRLRLGGQIWQASRHWKIGKYIPLCGFVLSPNIVKKAMTADRQKPIVLIAAGTGISPMIQLVDFYIKEQEKLKFFPPIFLIWILKSPEHNYREWIGLNERVTQSKRTLKWVIIYSSSKKRIGSTRKTRARTSLIHSSRNRVRESIFSSSNRSSYFSTTTRFKLSSSKKSLHEMGIDAKVKREAMNSFAERIEHDSELWGDQIPDSFPDHTFWKDGACKAMKMQLERGLVERLLVSILAFVKGEDSHETRNDNDKNFQGIKLDQDVVKSGMITYVSGSPRFDDDMRTWLESVGVPRDKIVNFYAPSLYEK